MGGIDGEDVPQTAAVGPSGGQQLPLIYDFLFLRSPSHLRLLCLRFLGLLWRVPWGVPCNCLQDLWIQIRFSDLWASILCFSFKQLCTAILNELH